VNDPEFTSQEQELIERLANAPQPSLNPAAFEMIRARMLDAMDAPQLDSSPRLPGRPTPINIPLIAALAAVLIVGVGIILLVANPPNQPTTITPLTAVPTAIPTFTPIPPTSTLLPEIVATVVPSPTVIQIVTDDPAEPTSEVTVISPSTATLEPVIIVEGPVEAIEENIVTIYGIDIVLNPDDPLLAVIQVGDVLYIEADYAEDETQIVAVTAEPVGDEVEVNPETGESWRDNGNCDNPPPPWAPANGWRRRCEAAPADANPPGQGQEQGNAGGNGNGKGQGSGNNGPGQGDKDNDD